MIRQIKDILGDDIGNITLSEYCGSDLRSVNNARSSYNKESESFEEKDQKLLDYLGSHQHNTPPRGGAVVMLDVDKIPLPIAMQWYKHVVGGEYAFKDCHGS